MLLDVDYTLVKMIETRKEISKMNKECELNKSKIPVSDQAHGKTLNFISQGNTNYNLSDVSFHPHYKVKHPSTFNFYPRAEPKKPKK